MSTVTTRWSAAAAAAAVVASGLIAPSVAQAATADFTVTATAAGFSPNTITLTKASGNTIEFQNQSGAQIQIWGGDDPQPANSPWAVVVVNAPGSVFPCDKANPCIEPTGSGILTVEVKRPGSLNVSLGSSAAKVMPLYYKPTKARNVVAATGNQSLTVTWQAPAETYGWPVKLYDVLAEPSKQRCTALPPALTCTLTGLPNGVTQTVFVTANTSGGVSDPEFALGTPASRPGAPKSVTAAAGDASATVSWSAPDDTGGAPITGYTVQAIANGSQSPQSCSTQGATSCTVSGLTNGTSYSFAVFATNAGGTGKGGVSNAVTPVGSLLAPTPTSSWDASAGELTVTWSPYNWAGNTPGSFHVEYRYAGGSWRDFNNTASPLAETAVFETLSAGTSVEFRVTAIAQDGTTSTPGTTSASVPNPNVPLSIVAGNAKANISWTQVAGADHYWFAWYEWGPGTPGGAARVTCSSDPCSYELTGLTNGQEYKAKVTAVAPNGRVIAMTEPDPSFTPSSTPQTPLAVPAVKVSFQGTTANLDWAPYNWGPWPVGEFRIRWTTDLAGVWSPYTYSKTTSTSIAGLTPGTTTWFEVEALSVESGTTWSSRHTQVSGVVPTQPLSLTISAAALDGAVNVSWQPVPSAATYRVGWHPLPNGAYDRILGITCTTGPCTTQIPGLVNGTTYKINVNAEKADGTLLVASNYVTATPTAPAPPLNVVYPVSANLQVGKPITISPDAQYSSGNPTSFTEGTPALPSGLHLNSKTGDITGTPLATADGLYPIKVANAQGETLTVPLRLTIAAHTVSLSYPSPSAHVGTPLTLTPTTSHVIGTMTGYAVTSGTLPAGLSLDASTGVISGTPTAATTGAVALTVTARDQYATAAANFTITVDAGVATLALSYPNAVAHVGKAQGITPTVSGAQGTLAFSLTAGTLPAGMTLDPASGVISGTPTTAQGATSVTVQVTDGSATDDATFTIEVFAHTLSLAYPSSTRDIGVPAQLSPVISHVEGTVSYAITSGTLPAGLSLNSATGVISGTPTTVTSGPVPLEITATDSYASATAPFTLQVTDPTPPVPVITGTLTRDVERLNVIGSVANASPGDIVTPMFKLTGQDTFTAGVPVTLDANGAFTWSRLVNSNKSAQVYFTVGTGTSPTLGAARPTVTATGSRSGTSITVTGTTRNIRAGSVVHPWIKVNGGKAIKGTPGVVGADGSFTWTYTAAKGDSVRVKFNVRGIKSDPIVL